MSGSIIRGQTPIRKTSVDAVGSFIGRHQDVRPFVQLYGNGYSRPVVTSGDRGDMSPLTFARYRVLLNCVDLTDTQYLKVSTLIFLCYCTLKQGWVIICTVRNFYRVQPEIFQGSIYPDFFWMLTRFFF